MGVILSSTSVYYLFTTICLQAPLPCIAASNRTPTNKNGTYLADFTPITPPMIPAILMCCIKEVEERGIDEIGIYRLSGSESDANEILDKFMKVCKLVQSTESWAVWIFLSVSQLDHLTR